MKILRSLKCLLWLPVLIWPALSYAQDGKAWSLMNSGVSNDLRDVQVWNSQLIVAVGQGGTVLRYDGSQWAPFAGAATAGWPSGVSLTSVAITAPDRVWVAGNALDGSTSHGYYSYWDGANWSAPDRLRNNSGVDLNMSINSMFGLSSSQVLALGRAGRIATWDGNSWARRTNVGSPVFTSVHGSGSDNLWAVASNNVVYRSADGGVTWSVQNGLPELTGTTDAARLNGVYSLNEQNTWIVGDRRWEVALWDGNDYTVWQLRNGAGGFKGVYAQDESNVWAVGTGGAVFYYNGADWAEINHGLTTETLWSVDMDELGRLVVVGDGGVVLTGIPEPALTVSLIALGMVSMIWMRRRKIG